AVLRARDDPRRYLETAGYDVLSEGRKQAMARKLAAFYAALHAIPLGEAIAGGAELKREWPEPAAVLPVLRGRLPGPVHVFAEFTELEQHDPSFVAALIRWHDSWSCSRLSHL